MEMTATLEGDELAMSPPKDEQPREKTVNTYVIEHTPCGIRVALCKRRRTTLF